jgi:DNA-binding beta-propeller fold protein YncE
VKKFHTEQKKKMIPTCKRGSDEPESDNKRRAPEFTSNDKRPPVRMRDLAIAATAELRNPASRFYGVPRDMFEFYMTNRYLAEHRYVPGSTARGTGAVLCEHFARLDVPRGICFAPDGSLCITDFHDRVTILDAEGRVLRRIGLNRQMSCPWGVVVSDDMMLAVTESANDRVSQFTLDSGCLVRTFGEFGTGPGQFSGLRGICIDNDGNYIVADSLNNRLQRFTAAGEFLCVFATKFRFDRPMGLAFDRVTGDVVCCNTFANMVVILRADGSVRKVVGSNGIAPGCFKCPWDVCIDGEGRLIVADGNNDRLQIFDTSGAFLRQLSIQQPLSCVVDHRGAIYAVGSEGRIRVMS